MSGRALLALLLLATLQAATLAWAEHDASKGLLKDALEAATHGRVRAHRPIGHLTKFRSKMSI